MRPEQFTAAIEGINIVWLLLAAFVILCVFLGVRIVPQSEKYVVERFGRLRAVLGPGINFIIPFLDRVRHKISILERQLPNANQDAITSDNVLVQVETSVFYRILEPEKTVYRIRDVDAAIATTVAGIVRAEIGKMELDEVQSNRAQLISEIKASVADAVDDWGIEVTRAEILDVNLDQATRDAMLQQLNAERARRAQVTEAEGLVFQSNALYPHMSVFDNIAFGMRIHKTLGATIAYVTHDQIEAMTLADKIVLLNGGRIEQFGSPEQLYTQPDTLFAARFIGTPEINALMVTVEPATGGYAARLGEAILPLPSGVARRPISDRRAAVLGVRPEFLSIGASEAGVVTTGHLIELCEPMGSETSVELSFGDQRLRLRVPGLHHFEAGSRQSITWNFANAHLFDAETGAHL